MISKNYITYVEEENGQEVVGDIVVENYGVDFSQREYVVIHLDGRSLKVNGSDLRVAIENAIRANG